LFEVLLHAITGIARARTLSEATVANMKQNLGFAFLYHALGVPIAAGVLYLALGLLLSLLMAALAMSLSSVSVVGNALWLTRRISQYPFAGAAEFLIAGIKH